MQFTQTPEYILEIQNILKNNGFRSKYIPAIMNKNGFSNVIEFIESDIDTI